MDKKEIREWINMFVAILVLIVISIGVSQVYSLNLYLDKITAGEVATNKINVLGPNGSEVAVIEIAEDGTLKIEGVKGITYVSNTSIFRQYVNESGWWVSEVD